MIGAGLLLLLMGAFGLLNAWQAIPAYWEGWPGWIAPIEAVAVAIPSLAFGFMLVTRKSRVVPWATAWTLGCLTITTMALVPWGFFVPLLGGGGPAFSPIHPGFGSQFEVSLAGWFMRHAPGFAFWLIPAAVAYLLAGLMLGCAWLQLRRERGVNDRARQQDGLAGWGGLLLEAIGVVNVYGALYLMSEFRFGDMEILNWPFAIAGALGLPLGVAMAIAGHRLRRGEANRLAVGAVAAAASLVVLLGVLTGAGLPINQWVAFALSGLPYVPAPGIVLIRGLGNFNGRWVPGPRSIVAAAGLFALSAILILASVPRRTSTSGP